MRLVSKHILVLCEGASECAYLQRLNALLSRLPPYSGFLQLIPKPSGKSEKTGGLTGCGSGDFGAVSHCYKKVKKDNFREKIEIWVDSDLYVRNDDDCLARYNGKPPGIPDFKFSIHNFEDFLAFHADDKRYGQWKRAMDGAGHFRHPLHSDDYRPLFLGVFPGYEKGRVAPFRVDEASLKNLFRHLRDDLPDFDMRELTAYESFACFLERILTENYPGGFGLRA